MDLNNEFQSQQTPKLYMPDTNCFRYKAYITQNNDSYNEQERRRYKKAASRFWKKIILESQSHTQQSEILVSSEVIHELKVQSYTLESKENKVINELTSILDVERTEVPQELEFLLREFSNYARKAYGNLLAPGLKMDYLRVSDARIFIHGYLNDAILATANIKDFISYPLFFNNTEAKLFDILKSEYIKIPMTYREIIEQDEMYQRLLSKMKEFKY